MKDNPLDKQLRALFQVHFRIANHKAWAMLMSLPWFNHGRWYIEIPERRKQDV